MQNIDLICVGKLNAKYFAEGVAEYQKRLAAFASFRIIELPEEKIEEKNASDAVVKKALDKEGKAILSNVRKGAAIVAMCIEGRQISSDELAQFLADRANRKNIAAIHSKTIRTTTPNSALKKVERFSIRPSRRRSA